MDFDCRSARLLVFTLFIIFVVPKWDTSKSAEWEHTVHDKAAIHTHTISIPWKAIILVCCCCCCCCSNTVIKFNKDENIYLFTIITCLRHWQTIFHIFFPQVICDSLQSAVSPNLPASISFTNIVMFIWNDIRKHMYAIAAQPVCAHGHTSDKSTLYTD